MLFLKSATASSLFPQFSINQLSRCLHRSMATSSRSQAHQQQSKSQSSPGQAFALEANQLMELIKQDDKYHSTQNIKKQFISLLETHQRISKQSHPLLMDLLIKTSHYPCFHLPNPTLLTLYRIICPNLHLKPVIDMNHLLNFVLNADPRLSQSPIYHQFLKFYLKRPLQLMRVKYQLDLERLTLWGAIKQLLSRTVQRGFLARTPGYERDLNILFPTRSLYLLLTNPEGRDSLMAKKINYAIFMDIKEYYQRHMNQNLYHRNKYILMDRFDAYYMKVLAMQLERLELQNVYLRELYFKLYMTLPEEGEECQAHKYNKVMWLYRLAVEHIAKLDEVLKGETMDKLAEEIETVIEFVQSVQANFKQWDQLKKHVTEMEAEELLIMLNTIPQFRSSAPSELLINIVSLLKERYCAAELSQHFDLYLTFFKNYESALSRPFLIDLSALQLLSFEQIGNLTNLIATPQSTNLTLMGNLLHTVLHSDVAEVTHIQLKTCLRLCAAFQTHSASQSFQAHENAGQISDNAQKVRVFVMCFMSDHHKQLTLQHLQQVILMVMELPYESTIDFDDHDGNYPNGLFQQMKDYLDKVSLLMGQQFRRKLNQYLSAHQ